ncbi:fibronectin type III domain-containing protein [Modestobacter sp. Leaf380]|uniref:fibronectin type III domain-containing protein n=1 Tax=Modestobacter sp. Leaf380 TaxID=1736356 RepID=UPI0012F797F0|nr:fibronectin type III domain-containing protein [Modestobacter sp. Leaf380]
MDQTTGRRLRTARAAVALLLLGAVLLTVGPAQRAVPVDSPALATVSDADPLPPTNVQITVGDRRFTTISWTASSEPNRSGYLVRLGSTSITVNGADATSTGTVAAPAFTGLTNGTDYTVEVVTQTRYGFLNLASATGTVATTASAYPQDGLAPAAPTGVTAARGENRVTVSWAANTETDLAGYRVLRDGVVVSPTVTGPRTFVDTGLVNDRAYSYTVQAVDVSRQWSAGSSPAVSATPTDLTAPAAPTGLTAVRGDGRVTLSWTAATEPDLGSYRLLRNGTEVATVTGTTTTVDTGLVNDTTYTYTLVAVDTHGNRSPASAPAVSATPTDLTPPAVPTGLTAVRGDGRVTLSWTAATEPDLAFYRVLRDGVEVATRTTPAHVDGGLTNDTVYRYALVAVDTHGNRSAASAPPVAATPTDLTAPAVPTGLTATRGDGRVDLTWTANTEPDLAGYRVHRDGVLLTTVAAPATSLADVGLTNDTTYRYTITAVDTHGNASPASAPAVSATPTDLTPPAPPTGLTAGRGDGRVTLSWAAATEPDLASYRVLRDGVEVATVTTPAFVDAGLTNDTTHRYSLVAVDTHGNRSAASAPEVPATPTDLTAPAVPTGLVAVRGDGRVDLAWAASPEPDLASYRLHRDGVVLATVPAGTTTLADTGLTNDTTYRYAISAVDTHGNVSATSDPAVPATPTDLTAPAAPTGLTATRGDGRVDLTWAAATEPDLASYRVLRDGVEVATVTAPSHADPALTNDTAYRYTVVAVDSHGNRSPESAPADATPTDLTAPPAPVDVVATPGERRATVSWAPPTAVDVVEHRVLRDGVVVATSQGTSVLLTGLEPTAVTFTVVAVDGHGNVSPASAAVTVTPHDTTAPAAPTGVAGRAGDATATVSWQPVGDADLASYRVLQDGVVVATVTGTTATVSGLVNGTPYRFTVVAVDGTGNASAESVAVTVVPVATTVPTLGSGETGGLAASRDGRFVVVGTRAQLDPADTNSAYELYLLDRTAGTATRIAPLPATATGASDPTNTAAPAVSDDGRYVALATTAALVPADTNRLADVYRLDLRTRTWSLVSVPVAGTVSPTVAGTVLQSGASVAATSPTVAMSADGDLVVFYSARADLGPRDTNGAVDVYAKRPSTGVVTRVSTTATGTDLPRTATGPALALTPDGRTVVFPATSSSGPLVLYRKTLSGPGAGEAVVVSTVVAAGRTTEVAVYRDAGDVAVSDDGRYVVLVTAAKPAAPGTSWSTGLAYRKDTVTGALDPLGTGQTGSWEHQVGLDPTGRYAFYSTTAPLAAADTNGHTDVARRDLDTGALTLVTADAAGRPTTGPTGAVTTAEYGRVLPVTGDLVLLTTSQALLPSDGNRLRDLYAKDLGSGVVLSPVR